MDSLQGKVHITLEPLGYCLSLLPKLLLLLSF